jgi:hypothetical protein
MAGGGDGAIDEPWTIIELSADSGLTITAWTAEPGSKSSGV